MANMSQSTRVLRSLTFCLVIFISATFFKGADAKRGCSSFGHSCFGGHGKRSDGGMDVGTNSGVRSLQAELNQQNGRIGQEEVVAPRTIYPQTSNDLFGNADDIIPIRNGGFIDNNDENNSDQMKFHLSPYLRHWLIAYRKAQENGNEFPYNNMI